MTTPSSLQKSFNELFESQARRENEASFQAKKRKYKEIDLELYNNISVYSEFFQDPELISEISADAHRIYKKMQVKISRIRPRLEAVTDKRPQAKDVLSTRVMDNEHDQILDSAEAAVRENQFYVNPIVPKRRMYIRENSAAASPSMSQSTDDIDEGNNNEPQLDNNPDSQISSSVEDTRTSFELRDIFDNIAALVEQSPLNSVGSTYLYTLLNRQHDPASYIYTMPEHTSISKNRIDWKTIEETLITIILFTPGSSTKKGQEIELLGSHSIGDLRDAICCLLDFSTNSQDILNTQSKKLKPSFIYMDHVFYIDTRHATNTLESYQSHINRWLDKKKINKQVFNYQVVDMQSALLRDQNILFNRPFVFLHEDNCEHMFLIKDLRLISPNEYESLADFPRTTYTVKYVRLRCTMCTIYPASFITTEDILSGHSPCYFCETCFKSFHAESEYDKQYNYKTTRYYGTIY